MEDIKKFTIIKGIASGLYIPIWILYLTDLGYSLVEIGLIGAVYETVKFITEVPFGVLGDKYGIRFSLTNSILLAIITWVMFFVLVPKNIILVICAVSLWALSESFFSGSFETWISKETSQAAFSDEMYKIGKISVASMLIGSLLGGFIYYYYNRYAFLIVVILLLPLVNISLKISNYKLVGEDKFSLQSGFRLILSSVKVRLIIISGFFTALTYDTISNFYPAYFKNIGLDSRYTAISFTIAAILLFFLLIFSQKISKLYTDRKYLIIIDSIGILLIMILSLGVKVSSFVCNSLLLTFEDLRNPIVLDIINKEISDEYKNTTYSVNAIVNSIGEIVAGIIFGFIAQIYGLSIMFLLAALGLVASIFLYSKIANSNT